MATAVPTVVATAVPARAAVPTVAGNWELRVEFLQGARTHRLTLEQNGADLSGHQKSAQFDGQVAGALEADVIRFSFEQRYEASKLSYRFEGRVKDGAMEGTVVLGAASDQNGGIVNRSQFGAGEWRAKRVA